MRLINVATKALEKFDDHAQTIPEYAILSHTWGHESEEISFEELERGVTKEGTGQYKLDQCCSQAARHDISYAWIDTCCIDKKNPTELVEAINRMFIWYKNAKICYAYLHDVKAGEEPQKPQSSFWKSRWFSRGWTLQELIAPDILYFYDSNWNKLGSKRNLASTLEYITKIPRGFLLGTFPLKDASVAQRMSWAANRVTTRKEDLAYCLLGIFEIYMSMSYGEGDGAFIRLQEEIIKQINDDSILAWNLVGISSTTKSSTITPGGALAPNPSEFSESGHIVVPSAPRGSMRPLNTLGGSLQAERHMYTDPFGQCFVILQCHTNDSLEGQVVGIPVAARLEGYEDYIRLRGRSYVLLQPNVSHANPQKIRIPIRYSNAQEKTSQRFGFFIDNRLGKDLQLSEAIPRRNLERKDILITNDDTRSGRLHRLWVMFRQEQDESDSFVLVLERDCHELKPQAWYHVMTCDKAITLEEIKENFAKVSTCDRNKHCASNGTLNLEVTVSLERPGKQPMFVVRLLRTEQKADTYNITNMLQQHKLEAQVVAAFRSYRRGVDECEDFRKSIKGKELGLDRISKQLAEIEEQMTILANERLKLQKMEGVATSDLENLRAECAELEKSSAACLGRAKTLQDRLNIQHGSMTEAKKNFEDWTNEATNEMLKDINPIEHEFYLSVSDLSHRFLLLSASTGHEPPFRELAEKKIRTDIVAGDGSSLLNLAARSGHGYIVQTLLILGADIEATDNKGYSALGSACLNRHIDVSRLLLEHGANIEATNKTGWSPLKSACHFGHMDVARLLLDNGANIEATDMVGSSPLRYACRFGHIDVARLLLEHGANIEATDKTCSSPLIYACHFGHIDVARLLLDKGANIEATDMTGSSPLMNACVSGNTGIAMLLLDKGAAMDYYPQDGQGSGRQVALINAADGGHKEIVQLLLRRGANKYLKDTEGLTAKDRAEKKGHHDISEILDAWDPEGTAN